MYISIFTFFYIFYRYNNKTYLIDDIDLNTKPTDTFELRNGDKITYIAYYKKQYGITIEDDDQPLLISRPKKKDVRNGRRDSVYLLPELCFVTGLTTDMKSDRRMTTNIQALTRVAPHDRVKKMNDFAKQINS